MKDAFHHGTSDLLGIAAGTACEGLGGADAGIEGALACAAVGGGTAAAADYLERRDDLYYKFLDLASWEKLINSGIIGLLGIIFGVAAVILARSRARRTLPADVLKERRIAGNKFAALTFYIMGVCEFILGGLLLFFPPALAFGIVFLAVGTAQIIGGKIFTKRASAG